MPTSSPLIACGRSWTIHPACALFPVLPPDDINGLTADIAAHGLLSPVTLFDGMVLDGRNRLLACDLAGVEPNTVEWAPVNGTSPWAFAWSKNGARRDLLEGQKQAIFLVILRADAEWMAEVEARTAREKAGKPVAPVPQGPPKTREALAAVAGGSARTAQDVLTVEQADLALFAAVQAGTVSAKKAAAAVRRRKREAELESIATKEAKAAAGVYDVIVVDPPWPIVKIERKVRPNQTAPLDYPTMTIDEIRAVRLPMADACHVWLWTTQRFLPDAFGLLDAWGLAYVCTFVWHKPGGFQPVNLPQFNCEFALYARRGGAAFADTKALPTCFSAPRCAHSEKPDAFYEVVRRVTLGRRLDMFARRAIHGFDAWGKEAP